MHAVVAARETNINLFSSRSFVGASNNRRAARDLKETGKIPNAIDLNARGRHAES